MPGLVVVCKGSSTMVFAAATGSMQYKYTVPIGGPSLGPSRIVNGIVYVVNNNGYLTALGLTPANPISLVLSPPLPHPTRYH